MTLIKTGKRLSTPNAKMDCHATTRTRSLLVAAVGMMIVMGSSGSGGFFVAVEAFSMGAHRPALPRTRAMMSSRRPSRPNHSSLPTTRLMTGLFQAANTGSSSDKNSRTSVGWFRGFPSIMTRPHERGIFLFFASWAALVILIAGGGITTSAAAQQSSSSLRPAHMVVLAESALCLTWSGLILAISFMEAWVKFKAPFLEKYIAVDVGRHVFAALLTAELALCTGFWTGHAGLQQALHVARVPVGLPLPRSLFLLPALATASLLVELLWVTPRLFLRAQATIVQGFKANPTAKETLSASQVQELESISKTVKEQKPLPSSNWHKVYGFLELIKLVSLQLFVALSWIKTF